MTIWDQKIADARRPLDLRSIPDFAALFFWRNMGSFRRAWWGLIAVSAARNLLAFLTVFILSSIISNFSEISRDELLMWYAPVWFFALASGEALDYITRRYGEALPAVFSDVTARRFYAAMLSEPASYLQNVSKERITTLIGRYVGHVQSFLRDCEWELVAKITRFFLIMIVLAVQSPMVLLANGAYIVAFLILAFQLSSRFSVLADAYSRSAVELGSLQSNMVLNLNFIQRLGLKDFLHVALESRTLPSWGAFDNVRRFHAKRWFIQLNLFNLMYFGTMVYGVLQVKEGFLALGFLLLIKWSFDELWKVLVYAIEYYVALIQQRADAQLLRGALAPQGHQTLSAGATFSLGSWSKIELSSARADFVSNGGERCVAIEVPRLTIARGEWVGIVGPSGSGKSTTLLMLMNILRHGGTLSVDDDSIGEKRLSSKDVSIVTTTDPLFKISLRDNLTLGREIPDDAVLEALEVAGVDFALSLDSVVGSADFNLSAGQEQRVRLARGLLHPGSLLLLDEPFTALDQATKTTVRQRIKEHLTGRSVVIVTHATEDLLLVGREYEMADGVLCERGASCSD